MAYYTHYRASAVGLLLEETLEELSNELTDEQIQLVKLQFDRAISTGLAHHVRTRATLKGHCDHYRNYDNVWTFLLKGATIRWTDSSANNETQIDGLISIMAPDARQLATNQTH